VTRKKELQWHTEKSSSRRARGAFREPLRVQRPKLEEAERFYKTFGLDIRRVGTSSIYTPTGTRTAGVPCNERGDKKHFEYVSYGLFEEDPTLPQEIKPSEPHPLSDGKGLWLLDPDGVPNQLVVAPKVSPSAKCVPSPPACRCRR